MPIIANAKKALRQTKTRTERNRVIRAGVRNVVKKSEKQPDQSLLSKLFSSLDRAVKKNILHKNKAARLKSRAAKRVVAVSAPETKPAVKKVAKAAVKKTAKKAVKKTTKSSK